MSLERLNDIQSQINGVFAKICGDNVWALRWLTQATEYAQVWDNCVDAGDTPCPKQANRVLECVALEWPINPFWKANMVGLHAVMVCCVSSWKSSDADRRARYRAYDIASELGCYVAFLLGGQQHVNAHVPVLRKLCLDAADANDSLDK